MSLDQQTDPSTEQDSDNHPSGMMLEPATFVHQFESLSYQHDALCVDEVSAELLAQEFGTPLYVYSKTAIMRAYRAYTNAFAFIDHRIHYAVKANSNLAVLGVLSEAGAGFDIVSAGELARVLAVDADPSSIVYSGVGKSKDDIKKALEAGIGCFNVESMSELDTLDRVADEMGVQAPISIRINPDVDANTHPYISTGLKENKFGINHAKTIEAYQHAQSLENLSIKGIDYHIGSQITDLDPFVDALDKLMVLIDELEAVGITFEHVDLGGGLGVDYIDEDVPSVAEFADALMPKLQILQDKGMTILFEPGRSIVANAGVLLTKVEVLKPTEHKNFAIVDAAMNDLIRPSLYGSQMAVLPCVLPSGLVQSYSSVEAKTWDIVGQVCETGDFLAKNRVLSLAVGDILAITGAGAYGFAMSSNYNTRPRACEVMVDDHDYQEIRAREKFEDLFASEQTWKLG